jgi:hypothetical protein
MPGRADRRHGGIRPIHRDNKASPISLGLHFMKAKAIVATLLVAAATSADAHFAWPYPRKPVSPDESVHWIVINSNPWRQGAESELTAFADGRTRRGDASPSHGGPERLKIVAKRGKSTARRGTISLGSAPEES